MPVPLSSSPSMSTSTPTSPLPSSCAVCGVACSKQCAACHLTVYCGADHQKQHWAEHKALCKANRSAIPGAAYSIPFSISGFPRGQVPFPPPSSTAPSALKPTAKDAVASMTKFTVPANGWRRGLSEAKAAEWLVDSYRMRVDDDEAWGGGYLHGLYNPDNGKLEVLRDFLHFVLLARRHGVIGANSTASWWQQLATQAGKQLGFAFEKSDAQEKYGSENVFEVATGGRSLRYTAERVYGHGMSQYEEPSELYYQTKEEVDDALGDGFGGQAAKATIWAEIGGFSVWQAAHKKLKVGKR